VVAFTSSPGTVSRSSGYAPTTWHVSLVPNAINQVVPVGQPFTIEAEVLDKLNRQVALSGQPVYLGQVIYGQQGLVYGQAVINQAQQGQTPVVAYTNNQGIATFVIRGTQATEDPVYFEANSSTGRSTTLRLLGNTSHPVRSLTSMALVQAPRWPPSRRTGEPRRRAVDACTVHLDAVARLSWWVFGAQFVLTAAWTELLYSRYSVTWTARSTSRPRT